MNPNIQKSKRVTGPATLEILVFQAGGQWFGLRSSRQFRLLSFWAGQLAVSVTPAGKESGPVSYMTRDNASFPVYDLAFLLGLREEPVLPDEGQLIQAALEGQIVGFTIEQAQEIQRVPVPELRQLPAIISRSGVTPVIWAVWLRPDNTIIPLIDLALLPGIRA